MGLASIIASKWETLRGAPGISLICSALGIGDKTFECEMYSVPGIIGVPADGVQGVEVVVNGVRLFIAAHNYKLNKALNKGEALVYSIDDDGALLGQAYFDNTGQIVLNEGTDYAVKFNALQTAFNQLKSDFNGHIHSGVETGAGSTGATTASTADISPAKVDKVRL